MKPETALLIAVSAAVVGQVLGGLLALFGGWVNDYLAAAREDRRADREAKERQKQWEREDRLKAEENEEARQQEIREARARAYKAFVAATSFPALFEVN